jgi:iduronate 2-sulfatase
MTHLLLWLLFLFAVSDAHLNVLLIVSDDLRPDLGCYGGPAITPHLDTLAASPGTVRFDRAYVQQAICCPTRSSFLTGRRPDTTRVWDLKTQFRDAPGAAHWKTLPQVFREHGYWTAGMGKVFHPVKYLGELDDVAGGSWSAPYFHAHGGEDTKHPLASTDCGVAASVDSDEAPQPESNPSGASAGVMPELS